MKHILVIGSSNTDMVVKTEKFPAPGETVLGNTFFMNPGGKGANQAVAASRLGGRVTFISKLGRDYLGDQYIKTLKKERIDTRHVIRDDKLPSGVALITINSAGENNIVVAPGANFNFLPEKLTLISSYRENIPSCLYSLKYHLLRLSMP